MKINVFHTAELLTQPLTSGIQDSKHPCVPKWSLVSYSLQLYIHISSG